MNKKEFIDAMKVWIKLIENGDIYNDIRAEEDICNDDVLKMMGRLIKEDINEN